MEYGVGDLVVIPWRPAGDNPYTVVRHEIGMGGKPVLILVNGWGRTAAPLEADVLPYTRPEEE